MCLVSTAVQHGLVYLDCDGDGEWAKQKNTSECEANDLAETDTVGPKNDSQTSESLLPCRHTITRPAFVFTAILWKNS